MHVGGNGGMNMRSSIVEMISSDRNGSVSTAADHSATTERTSESIALTSVMYSIGLERKKIYEYNSTSQKYSCFGA